MYVAYKEQRQFSGKVYSGERKLDMYMKGACLLDKSLKINEGIGLTLLTNDAVSVMASLYRLNYSDLDILEIPFDLNVTEGCAFYSAHYKIDVYRYLGTLSENEYSILLDSDVLSISMLGEDFYNIVHSGIPMVYNLPAYGGSKRLLDIRKIDPNIEWCAWVGGEFISGTSSFFADLYNDIISFKEEYWRNINNDLFHVGDEMLTSIALNHLWEKHRTIDAGDMGYIYRYWSIYEDLKYSNVGASLIHFPGDKIFFNKSDLTSVDIKTIMKGYCFHHLKSFAKGCVKRLVDKNWKSKL